MKMLGCLGYYGGGLLRLLQNVGDVVGCFSSYLGGLEGFSRNRNFLQNGDKDVQENRRHIGWRLWRQVHQLIELGRGNAERHSNAIDRQNLRRIDAIDMIHRVIKIESGS